MGAKTGLRNISTGETWQCWTRFFTLRPARLSVRAIRPAERRWWSASSRTWRGEGRGRRCKRRANRRRSKVERKADFVEGEILELVGFGCAVGNEAHLLVKLDGRKG